MDTHTGKVLGAAMEAHPEFIEFITRENLDAILTEQNAGQTGIIDQTSAAKLGKIAGVQAFVFGKVLTIIEAFPAQTDKTSENTTSYDTKQGKVVQHAIYTVHRREGKVTIKAEMRIVDVATAQVKTQVPEDQVETDATCWITYQGDEDAIPYDAKSACTGGERALKIGQEMTIEGLDKIGVRFAQKLVSTFCSVPGGRRPPPAGARLRPTAGGGPLRLERSRALRHDPSRARSRRHNP